MRHVRLPVRRQPAVSDLRGQTARGFLAAGDPLARFLDLRRDLFKQALATAGVVAWGVVGVVLGARWGIFLLGAATPVELLLLGSIAFAVSSLRARARDLIVEGADDLVVVGAALLVKERRRLVNPRHRVRLARAAEHLVKTAERWPSIIRNARPVFDPAQVLAVAGELRAIAELLTQNDPDARAVALAERLLTSGTSPLYAQDSDELRCALESILHALADPQSRNSAGGPRLESPSSTRGSR